MRAVAHIKQRAVGRQAPTLARIFEFFLRLQIGKAVNKSGMLASGKLKNLVVQYRNSFAEIVGRKVVLLKHLAGLDLYFS